MNTVTINLSLPKELLERVDEMARRESRSRSELLRGSLRAYLAELSQWDQIFAYGEKKAKQLGVKNEEDVYRIVEGFREEERARVKKKA
ncbi:MAG: ribbon-helix-helix protein, CopG family [Candidatus Blackburnbacteria bacterium]|nr:ribbon-helix-helix protein, CopG family [Candidatus Blackburnbacteria bacterium]